MENAIALVERNRNPYSPAELEEFRSLILSKREEALEEIETMQGFLENILESDDAENSSNAHHMADAASDEETIQLYYRLITRTRNYVNQLDRALERIDNGTYGICRATGKPIPKGRLLAVPHTRYGMEAKRQGLDKAS